MSSRRGSGWLAARGRGALHGLAVTIIFAGLAPLGLSNDAAASSAEGGVQLRDEPRISMEKERLTISDKRVRVEYEFLNETSKDITAEVAFPIAPYEFQYDDPVGSRGIDDFRVWVEGKEVRYSVQAKATLGGVDYTGLLTKLSVDVASFGHFDDSGRISKDVQRLPATKQLELTKIGLLDAETKFPRWTVSKTYYWAQTFPAQAILHVRHEYRPVTGFMLVPAVDFGTSSTPEFSKFTEALGLAKLSDACMDSNLRNTLASAADKEPGGHIAAEWVDYILTTANTWKKPIKQFELIVERPDPDPQVPSHWYVSFCWEGQVRADGPNAFSAKRLNFVPARDLRVMFFRLDK